MLRIKLKEHTNTTILKQTTLPWRTQYRNGKQTYHKHTFKDWSGRGRRSRGGGGGEEGGGRRRGGSEEKKTEIYPRVGFIEIASK